MSENDRIIFSLDKISSELYFSTAKLESVASSYLFVQCQWIKLNLFQVEVELPVPAKLCFYNKVSQQYEVVVPRSGLAENTFYKVRLLVDYSLESTKAVFTLNEYTKYLSVSWVKSSVQVHREKFCLKAWNLFQAVSVQHTSLTVSEYNWIRISFTPSVAVPLYEKNSHEIFFVLEIPISNLFLPDLDFYQTLLNEGRLFVNGNTLTFDIVGSQTVGINKVLVQRGDSVSPIRIVFCPYDQNLAPGQALTYQIPMVRNPSITGAILSATFKVVRYRTSFFEEILLL